LRLCVKLLAYKKRAKKEKFHSQPASLVLTKIC
jgi:hypothetical protein